MVRPCTQCGRCCTSPDFMVHMEANADDIKRWRKQKRHDILRYADILSPKRGSFAEMAGFPFADLWISPTTGDDMKRCPFVRKLRGQEKYRCTIYETRPHVCRDYPSHVSHMEFVQCEMLEPGDTDDDVKRFMIDA